MEREYPCEQGPVSWVSTAWLEKHMSDRDVMILDCQPNVHDYIDEHIRDARYLNENVFRVGQLDIPTGYIPDQAMEAVLRRVGLENDAQVVVYSGLGSYKGWGDGLNQTMMAYTLARFGHNNVKLLDGGIDKWKAEKRPLTKEFPHVDEGGFRVNVRRDYYVDYAEFVTMKDRGDVMVIDSRPPELYEGQGPWAKPGHIPGAVNVPWHDFMDPKNTCRLKSDEQIKAVLFKHLITQDRTIICYCGTGREATSEFLLFKFYLNFPNVRLYEGSFTEWSAYPDNPTVTGKHSGALVGARAGK